MAPSTGQRLDWEVVFGRKAPVVLDLGAGEGSFSLAYSVRHPGKNIMAVERKAERARKAASRAQRLGLDHVKVLHCDIGYFLRCFVPPSSIWEIHLLFPDPWPKRRHAKRRLITPAFVSDVVLALLPGGFVRFVTDQAFYFEQAVEHFGRQKELQPEKEEVGSFPPSKFETIFLAQGLPVYRAIWRKIGGVLEQELPCALSGISVR
ncbi:tRNA (guanosine(46)-N7)-methyltransferase TrmB [Candidatus Methylacidithermus pantelleriae]|uniref:tRNA (guanosine(46)-N7)-methyltransferase TrmB n=1 Tax=Candidatus Methylacidithermus pantelleriae TaxID=2744239 RepID=UPI001BD5C7C6|nr:tRNA (guanosine(46)-N7)-methyltransferase TrmB [Candidatus Methylacidithermus pantelleriae]